jgi:hypothetical protein
MRRVLLLFMICHSSYLVKSQDFAPPSLAIGVGKVAYEKGKLDAGLVAELIATKQDEVKKELMKRWVLKICQGGSLAMQNFVQQNMEILLSDATGYVKKKEMLRNAAELALVLGIAEFYLSDLQKADERSNAERNFLLSYLLQLDQNSKAVFIKTFFPNQTVNPLSFDVKNVFQSSGTLTQGDSLSHAYYSQIRSFVPFGKWATAGRIQKTQANYVPESNLESTSVLTSAEAQAQRTSTNYLPKLELLLRFKNTLPLASERDIIIPNLGKFQIGQGIVSPNHLLIDLVYKVCVENQRIRNLGFFQRLDLNSNEFKWRNKYTQFEGTRLYEIWKPIEKKLSLKIDSLFNYFVPFEKIITQPGAHDSVLIDLVAINTFNSTLLNTRIFNSYTLSESEQEIIKNVSSIFEKHAFFSDLNTLPLNSDNQAKFSSFNDYIFYLKDKALPAIYALNAKTNGAFTQVQTELSSVINNLELSLTSKFSPSFNIRNADEYISLIKTVSNLDKVETYDKIIKFIADIGNLYSDSGVGSVINSFVNAYDKYATFDKEKNKIDIDVESIAVDLFNRYAKNSRSDLSLYFTVGVNNAVSHDHPLISKDGAGSYFTFVGEKIGFKWRLPGLNFTKRRALLNYPKDNYSKSKRKSRTTDNGRPPLINDLHLICYGSGLLYQIQELNSNSKIFNQPIGGISFGISLFNGLDFNFGYLAQVGNAKDFLWNAGFDINFTEYLSALKKKKSN